jgi:hypothetical protein
MRLPFADLFCHFESVTDLTRGILGLVTDLVFGTSKTLAVPSYKYARVLEKKTYTEDAQHASTCLLRRRIRYFILFVGMHRRSGEQVTGTSSSAILHRERANKVFGSALRDCSNASTSPSSTFSSPRLVFLLISGARLGIVKRAEVLIIAVILFTRIFRLGKKRTVFLSLTMSFIPSMI